MLRKAKVVKKEIKDKKVRFKPSSNSTTNLVSRYPKPNGNIIKSTFIVEKCSSVKCIHNNRGLCDRTPVMAIKENDIIINCKMFSFRKVSVLSESRFDALAVHSDLRD